MPASRRDTPSLMLRSYALEREVERLLKEERYELAVLLSQTLLELRVEAELVEYFDIIQEKQLREAALGVLPSYNIGNGRVQAFFERLVDFRMREEDAEAMDALREHVERRNRIAHGGERVSREDAMASLEAARAVPSSSTSCLTGRSVWRKFWKRRRAKSGARMTRTRTTGDEEAGSTSRRSAAPGVGVGSSGWGCRSDTRAAAKKTRGQACGMSNESLEAHLWKPLGSMWGSPLLTGVCKSSIRRGVHTRVRHSGKQP
jgi:hypothetical protein